MVEREKKNVGKETAVSTGEDKLNKSRETTHLPPD